MAAPGDDGRRARGRDSRDPDRADAGRERCLCATGAAVAATAFGDGPPAPHPGQTGRGGGRVGAAGGGRDPRADWLVALCVVASWVVDVRWLWGWLEWTGMMLGALGLWFTPVRLVGWVQRGRLGGGPKAASSPGRIAALTALSAALVALFASAVRQRGSGVRAPVRRPPARRARRDDPGGRVLLGLLVAGVALAATYLRRRTPRFDASPRRPAGRSPRGVGGTARAARSAVRGFVAVQVAGAVRLATTTSRAPPVSRTPTTRGRDSGNWPPGHRAHAARDRRRRAEDRSDRAP